jgi:hypothetical protein
MRIPLNFNQPNLCRLLAKMLAENRFRELLGFGNLKTLFETIHHLIYVKKDTRSSAVRNSNAPAADFDSNGFRLARTAR